MVAVADNGEFVFHPGSQTLKDQSELPFDARDLEVRNLEDGSILEFRPFSDVFVKEICRRANDNGVAAIFIDYGHAQTGTGDTLQAVKDHKFADPFEAPGEAYLTTHVDFPALAKRAKANGLKVYGPIAQGKFLLSLGLAQRAEQLMEKAAKEQAQLIASGAQRLAAPEQMGTLFNVIVLASAGLPKPAPL